MLPARFACPCVAITPAFKYAVITVAICPAKYSSPPLFIVAIALKAAKNPLYKVAITPVKVPFAAPAVVNGVPLGGVTVPFTVVFTVPAIIIESIPLASCAAK